MTVSLSLWVFLAGSGMVGLAACSASTNGEVPSNDSVIARIQEAWPAATEVHARASSLQMRVAGFPSASLPSSGHESLRVPSGWSIVTELAAPQSLLYRVAQDGLLRVTEVDHPAPRAVATPGKYKTFVGTGKWSNSPEPLLFDTEAGMVYELNARTGSARVLRDVQLRPLLTFFGVLPDSKQRWPDRYPGRMAPLFDYDASTARIFFVDCTTRKGWSDNIVALSVDNGSSEIIMDAADLGGRYFQGCAFVLGGERLYVTIGAMLVEISLAGEVLRWLRLPSGGGRIHYDPEGMTLFIERQNGAASAEAIPVNGGWLIDSRDLTLVGAFGHGHSFSWAPHGSRLALLRGSAQLCVLDEAQGERVLVSLVAEGDKDCYYYEEPVWSADGRLLACGLSRWIGDNVEHYGIALDCVGKAVLVFERRQLVALTWSAVYEPFAQ